MIHTCVPQSGLIVIPNYFPFTSPPCRAGYCTTTVYRKRRTRRGQDGTQTLVLDSIAIMDRQNEEERLPSFVEIQALSTVIQRHRKSRLLAALCSFLYIYCSLYPKRERSASTIQTSYSFSSMHAAVTTLFLKRLYRMP